MAIEREVKIKIDTSQADASVKKLNKNLEQTEKESKKVGQASEEAFGKLDSLTGGAITKVKNFASSLGRVATGFKGVGAAIAASGIGLLLVVVSSLVAAFKNTEAGQNTFAKLMGVIGSVTDNVVDVIASLGDFIIKIFSGDSEAIRALKNFGNKIFDLVGLPVKNLIDTVKTLGKVLGALFDGDIEGAFNELQNGVENIKGNFIEAGDAAKGFYDSAVKGSKDFVNQLQEEARIAAKIADDRATADVLDRNLITERAKAEAKVAALRNQAARRDLVNSKQRKALLQEASKVIDEITEKEIKSAELRRDAIIRENDLSGSNKEALDAQAEAEAKVINLQTQRAQKQRELAGELSAINEAAASEAKARSEKQKEQAAASAEVERKRLEDITKAREKFQTELENIEADTEEKKIELEQERAQEELDALIGTELEKQEAQLALDEVFFQKREELREKQAKERQDAEDKRRDEQRERDKKRREEEIEAEKTVAQAKEQINASYLNSVSSGLDVLGGLFEENKELQAGILVGQNVAKIAENIIATQAANAKIVAEGAALAIPSGGTSVAAAASLVAANNVSSGISIAASIAATAKGLAGLGKSGGGSGAPNNSDGGGRLQAPAFNLTASSGVNQIGGDVQGAQPVRAFVVGSDVTSQQEMDRATFGQAGI